VGDLKGAADSGRTRRATICAAISPYLAYWLYLRQPRVAAKKLAIGIGLCAAAVFSVVTIGTLVWSDSQDDAGTIKARITMYADIAGFIVIEIWDLYLLKDVRRQMKRNSP